MYIAFKETDIKRSYRGKVGCMCGCKGNYTEQQWAIKKTVADMKQAIADGIVTAVIANTGHFGIHTSTDKNLVVYYED